MRPLAALVVLAAACGGDPSGAAAGPTIYCALDEQFSRPLIERFATDLGIPVAARYDTEGAKTIGLVSAIMDEQKRPRCSVFWNNELGNTVRLGQMGLLEPYDSPAAAAVPAQFRDGKHLWTGFAARARILIVNTKVLPDRKDWPTSFRDLADPKWKGRCAVARPLTGTTLTHFTALRGVLGEAEFEKFFAAVQQNEVKWLAGNGATANETIAGRVAWAFTDTDDYHVAKTKGHPVACVFPDQGEGQIGTMLIPNSIALIKGGPDPQGARRLIDKILAVETEALLAAAEGAQMPLRTGVRGPIDPAILAIGTFRALSWDVAWTGENLNRCLQDFHKRFGL